MRLVFTAAWISPLGFILSLYILSLSVCSALYRGLSSASLASTGKYRVKGLVRNLEKAKEALSSPGGGGDDLEIELEQGDILDETSLGAAMKVRILVLIFMVWLRFGSPGGPGKQGSRFGCGLVVLCKATDSM